MATYVIGIIVMGIAAFAVKSIIRSKKNGECACGGSCKGCNGYCHSHE